MRTRLLIIALAVSSLFIFQPASTNSGIRFPER